MDVQINTYFCYLTSNTFAIYIYTFAIYIYENCQIIAKVHMLRLWRELHPIVCYTGCFKTKVSIKTFHSDLSIIIIQSVLIYLYTVDL